MGYTLKVLATIQTLRLSTDRRAAWVTLSKQFEYPRSTKDGQSGRCQNLVVGNAHIEKICYTHVE